MRTRVPSSLLQITLAASALLFARAASADAVMPPPDDCAPGSVGRSSHHGPHCVPTTCSTDDDCKSQLSWRDRDKGRTLVCRERLPLCIEKRDFRSWRRPDSGPNLVPVAVSACGRGGACAPPATCETAKRCVFEGDPEEPPAPTPGTSKPKDIAPTSPRPPSSANPSEAPKTGCGCGVVGNPDEPAVALSLAALGLFLARTARRRRGPLR